MTTMSIEDAQTRLSELVDQPTRTPAGLVQTAAETADAGTEGDTAADSADRVQGANFTELSFPNQLGW